MKKFSLLFVCSVVFIAVSSYMDAVYLWEFIKEQLPKISKLGSNDAVIGSIYLVILGGVVSWVLFE